MVDSNDIICIAQSLIQLHDGSWETVGQKSVPDSNVLISKIENFNNYPHILNQRDMVINL